MEAESGHTQTKDPDLKGLQAKLGEQKFQQIRDQTSFINNKFKNRNVMESISNLTEKKN